MYTSGLLLIVIATTVLGVFVSNLTPICLRCLCHAASSCNHTIGCLGEYCGPFQVNKAYWEDAGKIVLPDDTPSRAGAFLDCAEDYMCAQQIVENYMSNFADDCNGDGVTDCDDFAMLHFNLKTDCKTSLEGTNFGRRYSTCRPTVEPPGVVPLRINSRDRTNRRPYFQG
uniref:lysozyme n=1 Tax=Clastoptera arizonana TaxID=38151 RepID=A0A1B6CQ25_9HEMI